MMTSDNAGISAETVGSLLQPGSYHLVIRCMRFAIITANQIPVERRPVMTKSLRTTLYSVMSSDCIVWNVFIHGLITDRTRQKQVLSLYLF